VIRGALRITAGFGLVILGIIGIILPIMPGWIFLIPGLVILADYFRPIRRLVDWAKKKAIESGIAGGPSRKGGAPPPPSTSDG
jgi:uncharacterized membrane protein YbaN (DUF454 family)